jgi:hypothetical protein
MTNENRIGTVALALALVCGACSNSSSGSSPSGGTSDSSGASNSKAGASGGQSSSGSGKGGAGSSSSSSVTGACGPSVTPCPGDVVGSWEVASGCLDLSGEFATRGTGLGCNTAKVTGSVQVTGSFVTNAEKKFQDKTTTKGPVTITLAKDCLFMSGTWTKCDLISVAIEGLGFKDVKCVDGENGGCSCPAKIDHPASMGLIVAEPEPSGTYTNESNTLGIGENPLTGEKLEYAYCGANGKLTLTPKNASPPTTGTIVLQKATGTGGSSGSSSSSSSSGSGGSGGSSGGAGGTGGTTVKGGTTTSGGTTTPGGTTSSGTTSSGGTASGGTTSSTATGGNGGTASASGGAVGGTSAAGGTGGSTGPDLPCDILEKANTPCVAAYGMVRAIYKDYKGPLYQVRSKSSTTSTKDVTMLGDGYADIKVQDDFCASSGCTVSKLFDQSPKGNHLVLTPNVCWLSNNGQFGPKCSAANGAVQHESDVKSNPKIKVGGHDVYGLKTTNGLGNAYRVMKGNGVATGEDPEFIYAVMDTTLWTAWCCYDFGNAESTGQPDFYTSMEAIYYGNATMWGKGAGNGPWFACDYELVISPGGTKVAENIPAITSSVIKKFGTFMLKGFKGDHIALKFGDAQKSGLTTQWDGKRAREDANKVPVMQKQGSIILGSGGDGSYYGLGVFFEGAITAGVSEDKAVDDAIQANIVSAGYKE